MTNQAPAVINLVFRVQLFLLQRHGIQQKSLIFHACPPESSYSVCLWHLITYALGQYIFLKYPHLKARGIDNREQKPNNAINIRGIKGGEYSSLLYMTVLPLDQFQGYQCPELENPWLGNFHNSPSSPQPVDFHQFPPHLRGAVMESGALYALFAADIV